MPGGLCSWLTVFILIAYLSIRVEIAISASYNIQHEIFYNGMKNEKCPYFFSWFCSKEEKEEDGDNNAESYYPYTIYDN